MILMRHPLLVPLLAGTLLASSALSGCAAFSDEGSSTRASGGRLSVVTAFYPLQYAATRVAGDRAVVTNLTKPGGEPHDLEIPPRETADIVDADLVVYEKGFQPAVDDAVTQNAEGTTLDAASVVGLVAADHDGHDHGAEDHSSAAGAEGEHDHGDGSDLDPHFWQDPLRMATLGDALAKKLAAVDPDHAQEYAA